MGVRRECLHRCDPREGGEVTSCIACQNWNLKATDPSLARLGFAQCDKKKKFHTTSSDAKACEKFALVDNEKHQARVAWLEKKR